MCVLSSPCTVLSTQRQQYTQCPSWFFILEICRLCGSQTVTIDYTSYYLQYRVVGASDDKLHPVDSSTVISFVTSERCYEGLASSQCGIMDATLFRLLHDMDGNRGRMAVYTRHSCSIQTMHCCVRHTYTHFRRAARISRSIDIIFCHCFLTCTLICARFLVLESIRPWKSYREPWYDRMNFWDLDIV